MSAVMEVKSILSEKGRYLLVVNKFYKFCIANFLKDNTVRWRCANKRSNCSAKLYTSAANYEHIIYCDTNHNHDGHKKLQRQALSNSAKVRAQANLHKDTGNIIHEEILSQSLLFDDITAHDIDRIRRNVSKSKRGVLPVLPDRENPPNKELECASFLKVTQPDKEWKTYMNNRNKIADTCSSSVADSNYDDEHSQLSDDGSIKTEIKTEIDVEDTEISLSNDESRLHSDDDSKDNIVKCTEDSDEPLAKKSRYEISHIKEEIPEEPGEADNIEIKEETPAEECDVQERLLSEQQGKEIGERAIETFFKSMAATVMTFPPHLIAETRLRVCEIVSEIELRLLTERQRDRDYV